MGHSQPNLSLEINGLGPPNIDLDFQNSNFDQFSNLPILFHPARLSDRPE